MADSKKKPSHQNKIAARVKSKTKWRLGLPPASRLRVSPLRGLGFRPLRGLYLICIKLHELGAHILSHKIQNKTICPLWKFSNISERFQVRVVKPKPKLLL